MTDRVDVARGRDVVARWCALAEQRLDYLTELFETGRWRRFHGELAFLENIQEAKAAVEIWRDLAAREASRNSPADITWPADSRPALPRGETLRDRARWLQRQPVQIAVQAPRRDVSILPETKIVYSDEVPAAPELTAPAMDLMLDNGSELSLDIAVMQERYPLLRNAL
jgi:uncharacterized repeat protein (TIGR03809 family)